MEIKEDNKEESKEEKEKNNEENKNEVTKEKEKGNDNEVNPSLVPEIINNKNNEINNTDNINKNTKKEEKPTSMLFQKLKLKLNSITSTITKKITTKNEQNITNENKEESKNKVNELKNEDNNNDNKNEFSKDELKKLFFKFHTIIIENKKYDNSIQDFTNIFDTLAEFLINGDKNDPSIFDAFTSLQYLQDIMILMEKRNKDINIQIIKFFSVLMSNLSSKNFEIFLPKIDFINQIIYFDQELIDGDYLYYYINFIKALLFKINFDTIKYFYHEETYTFPLLANILKFYNHPDNMISNTIRNIFLFVLKMGYQPCIDYICTLPMLSYFAFISCRLRDEIITLNKKIMKNKSTDSSILHERICNDIMYFQDIFSVNIEKINFILINSIFHFLILPTICNSLIIKPETGKKNFMDTFGLMNKDINLIDFTKIIVKEISKDDDPLLVKHIISKELAIYILNLFFKYIKNETFLNLLLSVLFLPKVYHKLMDKIKRPVKDPFNYRGDYDTKSKRKLVLERYIIENFNQHFMRALMTYPKKVCTELFKIEKKVIEKCRITDVVYDIYKPVPYGFYMEVINDYFSRGGIKECREYDQIISEATGIQCGLTYHWDRKSALYLMNKNLKYINSDFSFEKIKNKYVNNIISENFLTEFKECKSLFLLLMYNYLFNQILNNKIVSKGLLAYIELLNPEDINTNTKSDIEEENDPILQVGDLIKSNEEETKKEKKNIIKDITFANLYKVMYFKDFVLKEFNLYDNNILKKYFNNGQVEYNIIILGVTLNYLNRDEILRPEIYLFLIKLINDLILYKKEENGKKYFLKLRDNHISIIKNIFTKNVTKIVYILNNFVISDDDLKKIFEFFWQKNDEKENYFEEYDVMITDFMEDCLFLLSKKIEDKNKSYIHKLKLYNSLLISNIELKIRIYLIKLFFDIYDGVCEGKIKEIKIDEINDDNKNKWKEIIVNNFSKLIFKENDNNTNEKNSDNISSNAIKKNNENKYDKDTKENNEKKD